jgi:hypothetical protein
MLDCVCVQMGPAHCNEHIDTVTTIVPIAYLGNWALVILIIVTKFMVN